MTNNKEKDKRKLVKLNMKNKEETKSEKRKNIPLITKLEEPKDLKEKNWNYKQERNEKKMKK